jgi:hypothetical protein
MSKIMSVKLLLLTGALLLSVPVGAQSPVSFRQNDIGLHIQINKKPFAPYVWRDANILRPYFAHVHAPNGKPVTRNRPPVEGKDATDHATLHPGLWLAFGDLGGADFWRNKAEVKHVEFIEKPRATRDGGSFAVRNRYVSGEKTVCEEICRIRIRVRPGRSLLDWTSEYSGTEDFTFGDQEEMGLGVRVATALAVQNGGQIGNSEGAKNEKEVWGKQADWCDYSGVLVANPFGQNAFTRGEKSTVLVRKGETLRLRFGVLFHAGKIDIAAAYKEWQTDYWTLTTDEV